MSISLLGSINVCKVNTGWANKIQSDRFENPNNMMCPLWNGQDTYGRFVAPDSFYTKTAGCASADDRVEVENFLRPQYMEYVALDAAGFKAPLYAGYPPAGFVEGYQNGTRQMSPVQENYAMLTGTAPNSQFARDATCTRRDALNAYSIAGSFGGDYGKTNTLTDKGLNGVMGGGNAGCGQWFNGCPPNLHAMGYEGYQPDQQSVVNAAQRSALSAQADFRSSAARTWSGN